MRTNRMAITLGLLTVAATFLAIESDASACGGCFTPTENPTVVTDHRMILTVSKEQSTLYDQIKFSSGSVVTIASSPARSTSGSARTSSSPRSTG